MKNKQTIQNEQESHRMLSDFYDYNKEPFFALARKWYQLADAELADIYQEAFVAMHQNIKSGKYRQQPGCSLQTYLFQIGLNKLKDYFKGKKSGLQPIENIPDLKDESTEEGEELHRELYRVVDTLPSPYRDILFAFYWDGKGMNEISQQLGYKDADSAKTQKYKCMKNIRQMLKEKGFLQ